MRKAPIACPARVLVELLLAAVVLGLTAGLLWWVLTPEIQGEIAPTGVVVSNAESRRQFGVAGWFAMLAAAGGLLLGSVGFIRHRRRPVTALVVLVFAGLVAAALQWWFGTLLGPGPVADRSAGLPTGATISMPLDLNAYAALFLWPIGAVISSLVVAVFLDDHEPWSARLSRRERSEPSLPP